MNLILLGMPGAGKGTQAEIIQREQGIANVSTGAMMREVSRAETDLGKKVQEYLSTGKLVPDDIIIQMLVERISQSDCENGFLLDGFPRNLDQAKALDEAKVEINLILFLKISEKEIIERMSGRRVHLPSGRSYHIVHNPPKVEGKDDLTGETLIQREDDHPDVIKKRLEVYYDETEPLLSFYRQKDISFYEIDASKTLEEVTEDIRKVISH
ncbi:MAG: adenylate kinase [Gammaproteobacteria bacterium]|jgi:adenylate kinase|nr:MAG: adenylate kinase [Gammaproteobacteria bacterium]|tara:strand:- start:383 stop:1018 length:636 start_codon:yes stop_codon:yes gene_type:complete